MEQSAADLRLADNYARFRRLLKGHMLRLRLRRLVTVCSFGRRVQIYLFIYLHRQVHKTAITSTNTSTDVSRFMNYYYAPAP